MKFSFKAISIAVLTFSATFVFPTSAADLDPTVIAVVNSQIVQKYELLAVMEQYKQKTHKKTLDQNEKIELLNGIIRRKLILGQERVAEIRKLPLIQQRVKAFEDQLVVQYYLNEKIGSRLQVTDEEMRQYYRDHLDKFIAPPRVKASHILLRSEAEAQQVLKALNAGGDFAELAKKYSIDLPMAMEGGPMGIIAKGNTLPALEKELFILAPGEYSQNIVKSQYGYHILKVDEIVVEKHYPYEEVREKIKSAVKGEKDAQAFEEMVGEIEKDAKIEIYEERL